MNKLLSFKSLAIITGFMLMFGLLTSCAKSSETKVIAANQSNENDKKPMTMPTANKNEKDEASAG